jgi:hypothetical protein
MSVVEHGHAALVARIGGCLVLEHGDGPARRLGQHRLRVPVGALDQPHRHRAAPPGRPLDEPLEVVDRLLEVRLDDDPGIQVDELCLVQERPEELEGQILGPVVLHVQVHERAAIARRAEKGAQPFGGAGQPSRPGQRRVARRQGGWLHRHVDPGERTDVVGLEHRPRGPGGRRLDQGVEHLSHPDGIVVRLGLHHGPLAEQVHGGGAPGLPELAQAAHRRGGVGAHDEVLREASDVATSHRRRQPRAERRHCVGQGDADSERSGGPMAGEVLLEVGQDVGVIEGGREGVDETEQLGPEVGALHGAIEQALAPPRPGQRRRGAVGPGGRYIPDERGDLGVQGRTHCGRGYRRAVVWAWPSRQSARVVRAAATMSATWGRTASSRVGS